MYAQEQFVIHMARIIVYQNNQCLKRVFYYNNIVLLQKNNSTLSIRSQHPTGTVERRKCQLEYFLVEVLHDFSIF
jgi:ABC-type hemin transport system ATPase subunit